MLFGKRKNQVFIALLLTYTAAISGFYIPGVAVKGYEDGEIIKLKVNKLTSVSTHLPYSNYDLPFCQPATIVDDTENLGEVLMGEVIENSPYEIQMNTDVFCKVLCKKSYTEEEMKKFAIKIDEGYYANWILDNLPAASLVFDRADTEEKFYDRGLPIGGQMKLPDGELVRYLNNHAAITLDYHVPDEQPEKRRVVGFTVEPLSYKYSGYPADLQPGTCPQGMVPPSVPVYDSSIVQSFDTAADVVWTYSVLWRPSTIKWASRWDVYLQMGEGDSPHWFSILNSLAVAVLLAALVGTILGRTLRNDLMRYNRVPTDEEKEEQREDSGWKLLHGDIFRPPPRLLLLAVLQGTGLQLLCCFVTTLVFSALGFLSPANRGAAMIVLLLSFMFAGLPAGFATASVYKFYGGDLWQRATLCTSLLFPLSAFATFFTLNLLVWGTGSSGAAPFSSMCVLLLLWLLLSTPLVFLGAYLSYRRQPVPPPAAVSPLPRLIPTQPWYFHPAILMAVAGMFPFCACFVELYLILSSIWLDQYYYVFGFLCLVTLFLLVGVAEVTIVITYVKCVNEDWQWPWLSLCCGGSVAVYVFVYSVYYFCSVLSIVNLVSSLLYFGYMALISSALFIALGSLGFWCAFTFNWLIFGALKVD